MENLFGPKRQQTINNCDDSIVVQFQRTFSNLFGAKLIISGTQNCEDDMDNMLFRVSDVIKDTKLPTFHIPLKTHFSELGSNYEKESTLETNLEKKYFEGYLV